MRLSLCPQLFPHRRRHLGNLPPRPSRPPALRARAARGPAMTPADVIHAGAFGAGAIVGSFANVCIHRLPRGESVVWPRPAARRAGRSIAAYDNVPILSWLVLRGRCRPATLRSRPATRSWKGRWRSAFSGRRSRGGRRPRRSPGCSWAPRRSSSWRPTSRAGSSPTRSRSERSLSRSSSPPSATSAGALPGCPSAPGRASRWRLFSGPLWAPASSSRYGPSISGFAAWRGWDWGTSR